MKLYNDSKRGLLYHENWPAQQIQTGPRSWRMNPKFKEALSSALNVSNEEEVNNYLTSIKFNLRFGKLLLGTMFNLPEGTTASWDKYHTTRVFIHLPNKEEAKPETITVERTSYGGDSYPLINVVEKVEPDNSAHRPISKYSNSEIGSHHWAATVLSFVMRVGEYMSKHDPTPLEIKHYSDWGPQIKERGVEVNNYLHSLPENIESFRKENEELKAISDRLGNEVNSSFLEIEQLKKDKAELLEDRNDLLKKVEFWQTEHGKTTAELRNKIVPKIDENPQA